MRSLLLFTYSVLLIGCSSTKDIVGTYFAKENDSHAEVVFKFKPDSLLEMTYRSIYTGKIEVDGIWYRKDSIIYTPQEIEASSVITYNKEINKSQNYPTLHLIDLSTNSKIDFAIVKSNDQGVAFLKVGEGKYNIINSSQLNSFKVEILSQSIEIELEETLNQFDQINILADFRKAQANFMYSEKWLLKGKKLIALDGKMTLVKRHN